MADRSGLRLVGRVRRQNPDQPHFLTGKMGLAGGEPPYEPKLHASGYQLIAGIDEAGRGALAGAVVAAAVMLPPGVAIDGLADSKQLSPQQRERLFSLIQAAALAIGVGIVEEAIIDEINILRASLLAMKKAASSLNPPPHFLLVDGNHLPSLDLPSLALPKGESRSPSIAAASIIAKVTRDRLMVQSHRLYPAYGFDRHKGYGTPDHLQALMERGPCPIHRRTFKGVRECLPQDACGNGKPSDPPETPLLEFD